MPDSSHWKVIITPKTNIFRIPVKQIFEYRDLLFLFVKRDFIAYYKQTLLGPLWFFIQPLITSAIYILVFNKIGSLPTGSVPPVLFYMSGITCWNYFSDCLLKIADTFSVNASIFGKVYFPRLIVPLSIVISNLIRFIIQFLLFGIILFYFSFSNFSFRINLSVLLIPFLVTIMAALAIGIGLIFSSFTIKYRDLKFLLAFGIQLFMFTTPVIIPSSLAYGKMGWIMKLNPMTPVIDTFRYSFFNTGNLHAAPLLYSCSISALILTVGIIFFNKAEKTFIDTI
jgi:lipopolysaccharide transport system permease protein